MESQVYLKSLNIHSFRHEKENPRVIGFVKYTPENYKERPCFKVIYESDNLIDYIPHSDLVDGVWELV